MNNKMQPAVIGGVVLGLLSAIPFVNFGNICCCAWAILGGALAAYLYIKRSEIPARAGDGAVLGAIAGLIGTVITWIVGIPLNILTGDLFTAMIINLIARANPEQAEIMRKQMELAQNMPFSQRLPSILLGMVMGIVLYTLFAVIGGLIGTAIFEKRKGGQAPIAPPPPPPSYGQSY